MQTDPVALLRRHLGYPGFRPGQEPLVRAVLSGRDALGVLPTGGGKSVCYQVPALALGGLTLVVTPLVSLMEDQVGRALAAGLRAAHLSASQGPTRRRAVLAAVSADALDVLFVSPERLELEAFGRVVEQARVSLLAVDEAHCISEWGHDFRPAYRRIGRFSAGLGCPTLALTATATPRVREDVLRSLGLRRPLVVVRSFDRPNLSWFVTGAPRAADRAAAAYRVLRARGGCAIVYAPTRRTVERTRDALAARGVAAQAYHAGLRGDERSSVQRAFMEGRARIVVATNAFGMGIDKADVRTVVHVQLPSTLEAYYQEAGRAGRDGAPACCVAFHTSADRTLARTFIDRSHPPAGELRRVHRMLVASADAAGFVDLGAAALARLEPDVEEWRAGSGGPLAALERIGALRRLDGEGSSRLGVRAGARLGLAAVHRRAALDKALAVERYARSRTCRRRTLLGYFGEEAQPSCGRCDRCGAAPGAG